MWFLLTVSIVNISFILLMPKRLSLKEFYVSWWTVTLIAVFADVMLGGVFDLYNYGKDGVDLPTLLLHLVHEPSFALIFLNFLPKGIKPFLGYVTLWLIISLVYESLVIHLQILRYQGWHLSYSAIFYVFNCFFLRWHLQFIRK